MQRCLLLLAAFLVFGANSFCGDDSGSDSSSGSDRGSSGSFEVRSLIFADELSADLFKATEGMAVFMEGVPKVKQKEVALAGISDSNPRKTEIISRLGKNGTQSFENKVGPQLVSDALAHSSFDTSIANIVCCKKRQVSAEERRRLGGLRPMKRSAHGEYYWQGRGDTLYEYSEDQLGLVVYDPVKAQRYITDALLSMESLAAGCKIVPEGPSLPEWVQVSCCGTVVHGGCLATGVNSKSKCLSGCGKKASLAGVVPAGSETKGSRCGACLEDYKPVVVPTASGMDTRGQVSGSSSTKKRAGRSRRGTKRVRD